MLMLMLMLAFLSRAERRRGEKREEKRKEEKSGDFVSSLVLGNYSHAVKHCVALM